MNGIRKALIVDDDDEVLRLCKTSLQSFTGWTVSVAGSVDAAVGAARRDGPDVILLDVMMPGGGGLSVLGRLKESDATATIPVVLLTAAEPSGIAACRERGALGVIPKPFDPVALPEQILRIIDADSGTELVSPSGASVEIAGESAAVVRLRSLVARAAASDASVLVTGESGTGKELVARALHDAGPRSGGPFVALNCAAIPEELLESELFGHVRGAFTDAKGARRGLFLEADGGTLFLDEIGELSPRLQPKLLRVLQERTVRPVGGSAEIPFDVRLVAATNEDLSAAVAARRFRSDLFFRVNVIPIRVPPLRARGDDVVLLAQRFAATYSRRHRRRVAGFSAEAVERLRAHSWPGNVRELQNAVERAVALTDREEISAEDLHGLLGEGDPAFCQAAPADGVLLPLAEVERRHIFHVLEAVQGNKRLAARILGIDRRTLYRKLDQFQAG